MPQGVLQDLVAVLEELAVEEESYGAADISTGRRGPFTRNPREVRVCYVLDRMSSGLSHDPPLTRQAWMGILAIVTVLHRRILDECLLPRLPSLLPLAALAILSGGAALFPAMRLIGHISASLGPRIWAHFPSAYRAPGLLWSALVNHITRGGSGVGSASVPVRKAALEVLPTLFDALDGQESATERDARARDLM